MAVYALNHKGAEFSGRLENVNSGDDQSLSQNDGVFVILTKPDGTRLTLAAQIDDDNADLSDGADIIWRDTADGPSVLDRAGWWEYTVAASFSDGRYLESPYGEGFWVV